MLGLRFSEHCLYPLGYNAMQADNVKLTCCHSTLISYLAYSLTLIMKAICSSKTSVDFHYARCNYFSEDKLPILSCLLLTALYLFFAWLILQQ
jgi:hypothetical protein